MTGAWASTSLSVHGADDIRIDIMPVKDWWCVLFFKGQHGPDFVGMHIMDERRMKAWQTLADTLAALDVPAKEDV